jgi:hypothetical protein
MPLSAGGSSERVVIDRLVINGVDYTLVVTPSDNAIRDPYFGHCKRFEVHGTYRWLRGTLFRQEPGLSRTRHLEALHYLQQAYEAQRPLELGWVGTGFMLFDPANPCMVKSRALALFKDDRGTYVLSYHDSTSARSD